MTLPGGAAAKLGHRYERWWTLSELVRMLRGDTDSLRLEEPGLDGVEFVVDAGGQREYHQAKRSHPSGKWSMAMLASAGVLASIGKYLVGDQSRFVFVSSSDARELADLCEGAVDAESFEEFEAQFLGAERRSSGHERVLKAWQCDGHAAWDVLRRVAVHTISERQLEDKVRLGLSALFLGQVDQLRAQLAAIVDDDVHRTLERDELLSRLEGAGFLLRKVSSSHAARHAVVSATDRYLQGVRRNLIQGSLIPRDKTAEIVERVTSEQPGDCVLVGLAGTGKTGCVIEVIEKLVANGNRVLALRLDRHMSATSTTDLGRRLELEESPALVLSAASKTDDARSVLIVDQLDAVSAMSGRSSEAFDVVERLLKEAKVASIGTVVVCRAFDWHNDPRLRGLIREDNAEVVLGELTSDDVRSVLMRAGYDARAFSTRQLELLHLPQNLSMFVDADFTPSIPFSSEGHLFGRYWDEKRRLIEDRAEGAADRWKDVIATMCDAMSATQQLSVPKEGLDQFSLRYLDQFVSESVLVRDGNSYAFGHERFFDYCFARLFVTREQSLVRLLGSDEQHLFRRAQVRQVLAYLRESDFERYTMELRSLVYDGGVRMHVKDLVFAWLATVDAPRDEEWATWFDFVKPYLFAIEKGEKCSDKQIIRAWESVFYAKSWFKLFEERLVRRWLRAEGHHLDLATDYLRWHQEDWPDEVAAYLEPFADRGGDWGRRLRAVMFHPQSCHSRRYFDLFLRLMDNGILDADDDHSFGQGVESVYYGLRERQPDWIPEILGRQVRRLCALVAKNTGRAEEMGLDELGGTSIEAIQEAAKDTPASFVRHVLPAVLDLAEIAARDRQDPPIYDAVWSILLWGSSSAADACLQAVAVALAKLAGDDEDLSAWIKVLSGGETHVANHLLLALYRGGGHRYADQAVLSFCYQPWRFECGYSGNDYWCAMETLKVVVPHSKIENRVELERVILAHLGPYERTREGVKHRGWAAFNLLSAIAEQLSSDSTKRRYQELQRKFSSPSAPPKEIVGGIVGSPIPSERADKMSDDAWRKAIAAYSTEGRAYFVMDDDRLHGGARELALVFGNAVKEDPTRFARLGLDLPPETSPFYFSALLRGLGETTVDDDIKVAVCEQVFGLARTECGSDIADLLAKTNTPLPNHALDMLFWLAIETEHIGEDAEGLNGGGDIYTKGINTTSGRAALAIGELILKDDSYISQVKPSLRELVGVRSVAVGSCVAFTLRAVALHDAALGIELFLGMDFSDARLLGTRHVHGFVREHLRHGVAELRGVLDQMLRSVDPDVSRHGARLACMAAFFDDDAKELADLSRGSHRDHRLGAAEVAGANVGEPAYREWCEDALRGFFVDTDVEVRKVAASCFRNIPEGALTSFGDLVEEFSNSEAYSDDAFSLVNALKKARAPLPAMTCLVCEKLLERTDHRRRDLWNVSELVFRLYQQHPNDEWTKRCLDLIDCLCLEAPYEASRALGAFER